MHPEGFQVGALVCQQALFFIPESRTPIRPGHKKYIFCLKKYCVIQPFMQFKLAPSLITASN